MMRRDKKKTGGILRAIAMFMVMVLIVSVMPMDAYADDVNNLTLIFENDQTGKYADLGLEHFYICDIITGEKYYFVEKKYYSSGNYWGIVATFPKGVTIKVKNDRGEGEITFEGGAKCYCRFKTLNVRTEEGVVDSIYSISWGVYSADVINVPKKEGYEIVGWLDDKGNEIALPLSVYYFMNDDIRSIYPVWGECSHEFSDAWEYDDYYHYHICEKCGSHEEDIAHTMGEWIEVTPATADTVGMEERQCTVCDYTEEREIPKLTYIMIHFYNCDSESGVDSIVSLFYATDVSTGKMYDFEKKLESDGDWYLVSYVPRNTRYILQTKQGVTLDHGQMLTGGSFYNAGLYTAYFRDGDEIVDKIYSWTNPDYGYIPEEIVSVPEKAGYVFNGWKLEDGTKITFPVHPYYTDGWVGYTLNVYADWVEHDHDFTGREEVAEEPTCMDEGTRHIYCAKDGCSKYIEESIDKVSHSYKAEWEYDSEYHFHACKYCGLHEEDIFHEMGLWTEVIPVGFREDGLKERKCVICDYTEEQIIPKLSESHVHDFTGNEDIVDESTCTKEGLKKVYCVEAECGEYIEKAIDKIEHSYKDEWEYDSGYHYHTCEVCEIHEEDIAHEMGRWMEVSPVSFTQDGTEKRKCTTCDYEETRRIPKLSESHVHDFTGREEIVDDATCTQKGLKKVYCTEPECGEWIEDNIEIIPHEYKSEWEYNNEYHYHICKACGIREEDITHEMGQWTELIPAKFNEDGVEERKCTTCDYKEQQKIQKLSESHVHDFAGREEIIDESTCTKEGLKKVYCTETECGASLEVPIMMKEHIYGPEWEYDGEAHYRICEVCGNRSDEHQHQFGEGVVVKNATENEDGIMEWSCQECAYVLQEPIKYVKPEATPDEEEDSKPAPEVAPKPTPEVMPDLPIVEEEAPYTGDIAPVKMYATLAMIAGFTYVLAMFVGDKLGMSEERKEDIVGKLVVFGKGRNRLVKTIVIAAIFVVLAYYHAIGKNCYRAEELIKEM